MANSIITKTGSYIPPERVPNSHFLNRTFYDPLGNRLQPDVVMPGLDGIGLVREVKKRDPSIESVAITGHDDVKLAVAAMKAGCADFLTKPVDREQLLDVAARALARVQLRREHAQLLSENLEIMKSQALYRQSLELLATLDLERLLDLGLSALGRVTDAQGMALWIADEKGLLALRGWARHLQRRLENRPDALGRHPDLRALGETVGGLTHNFNNSLAVIIAYTELLLKEAPGDNAQRRLRVIRDVALEASASLRRFQEMVSREPEVSFGPVALAAVVREALERRRPAGATRRSAGA